MGQTFFEQPGVFAERPKGEIELTREKIDALLEEIKAYTAGLLEREREVEKRIKSLGGEELLETERKELTHDCSWWREFEGDLGKRNFESVVVRQI